MRRGDVTLLDDVDWTIDEGQRWVVLGANGAGKSTLLQVLAGSIVPDDGEVTLLGEPLADADLDDVLPRVGLGERGAGRPTPCRRAGPRRRAHRVVRGRATRRWSSTRAATSARARTCSARSAAALLVDRRFGTLSARASASGCSWPAR